MPMEAPAGRRWPSRSLTAGTYGITSARPWSGPSPGTRSSLSAAITAPIRNPGPAETLPSAPAAPPRVRVGWIAERTRQRHAAIAALLAEGRSVRAIAAELGLARNTVRRFARAADPEELLVNDGTGRRRSMLEDHVPYLRQQWEQGCTDAAALWRELRARGYPGGYSRVRDYLAAFRDTTVIPAPAPQPPKVRQVTAWIMTDPGNLSKAATRQLNAITANCQQLAAVRAHVQTFAQLMTERRGHLEQWMTAATAAPELQSFIAGLRRDQDAVTAALTLPWSSGVVEGHINRIKMLKRRCTAVPTPTCSAAASSSATQRSRSRLTKSVPEPKFRRR